MKKDLSKLSDAEKAERARLDEEWARAFDWDRFDGEVKLVRFEDVEKEEEDGEEEREVRKDGGGDGDELQRQLDELILECESAKDDAEQKKQGEAVERCSSKSEEKMTSSARSVDHVEQRKESRAENAVDDDDGHAYGDVALREFNGRKWFSRLCGKCGREQRFGKKYAKANGRPAYEKVPACTGLPIVALEAVRDAWRDVRVLKRQLAQMSKELAHCRSVQEKVSAQLSIALEELKS